MVVIEINADHTVEVKWTGKKGRSSLYFLMAQGNAAALNMLSVEEILAAWNSSKAAPFPMGNGKEIYLAALELMKKPEKEEYKAAIKARLGELRKALIEDCGSSCNGPLDSYITIAKEHLEEMTPALVAEGEQDE